MKKERQKRLNGILKEYLFEFEQKQHVHVEHFVPKDIINGTILIADCYFDIKDIVFDIDNNLPEDLIFDWYWHCVNKEYKNTPCLEHYVKHNEEAQKKYFNNNEQN